MEIKGFRIFFRKLNAFNFVGFSHFYEFSSNQSYEKKKKKMKGHTKLVVLNDLDVDVFEFLFQVSLFQHSFHSFFVNSRNTILFRVSPPEVLTHCYFYRIGF